MGMAVMLDEIINYVQSLQNQVEVSLNDPTQLVFWLTKTHTQNDLLYLLDLVPLNEAICS